MNAADWAQAWTAEGWGGPAVVAAALLQAALSGHRDLSALSLALGAVALSDGQLAWAAGAALIGAFAALRGARLGVARPDVNAAALAAVLTAQLFVLGAVHGAPLVPEALFEASGRAICLLVGLLGVAAAWTRAGPRATRPQWWGRVVIT